MSTYISDFDLQAIDIQGTPGLVDIAYHYFGRDVRITVDNRTVYVSSTEARAIAVSILTRAAEVDRLASGGSAEL